MNTNVRATFFKKSAFDKPFKCFTSENDGRKNGITTNTNEIAAKPIKIHANNLPLL